MTEPTIGRIPIRADIDTDRAWRLPRGRTIYVSCAARSKLDQDLRAAGATWDGTHRALKIGAGKLAVVLQALDAHQGRTAAVEEIKALNHGVQIPYLAEEIRRYASEELRGVFDKPRKLWFMRTAADKDEIESRVHRWEEARRSARRAERASADKPAAEVIAASGRTAVDDTLQKFQLPLRGGRMVRGQAEKAAPQIGEVRHTDDGRRVLITSRTVEFHGQGWVEDFEPGTEPGWFCYITGVVVEATEAERAHDAAVAAVKADAQEIHDLLEAARRAADMAPVSPPHGLSKGGATITHLGVPGLGDFAVVRDLGERVMYQIPGDYDDIRQAEGEVTDPVVIARVRAVLAAGSRTRTHNRAKYQVRAAETSSQGEIS